MDAAERAGDKLENATNKRLQEIYQGALNTAIKNERDFLSTLRELDKRAATLPKDWTAQQVKEWKQGYMTEAIRRSGATSRIAKQLASVGGMAEREIRDMMYQLYGINRDWVGDMVNDAVGVSFDVFNARQLQTIVDEEMGSFTKVAFKNLENTQPIVRRLQNEFAQAALLGESQEQIIRRITRVAGQSTYGARRIVQTERTAVQSRARYDTMGEAVEQGVIMRKEWFARMRNTRDGHKENNGEVVDYDKAFSNGQLFPGDGRGGAKENINCFCQIIPRVVGIKKP